MSLLDLCNRQADVYAFVPSYDADGGVVPASSYPVKTFAAVWVVAQNTGSDRVESADGRVTTENAWLVGSPADYGVRVDWRIDLLASDGATVTNTLYVSGSTDAGGRGEVFEVNAVERT